MSEQRYSPTQCSFTASGEHKQNASLSPFAVSWWSVSYTSRNPRLENSIFTDMVGNADKRYAQNKG